MQKANASIDKVHFETGVAGNVKVGGVRPTESESSRLFCDVEFNPIYARIAISRLVWTGKFPVSLHYTFSLSLLPPKRFHFLPFTAILYFAHR